MLSHLGRRYRNESGAALILALIIVSILAIGSAAILTLANTNVKTTEAVRTQGDYVYGADGAIQGAINTVRSNGTLGQDPALTGGTNKCSITQTVSINNVTPTVSCVGTAGSGGILNTSSNTPGYALVALGVGNQTGDGIALTVKNNHNAVVNGSVASNYTLASSGNGSSTINGDASAGSGSCSTLTVTGASNCPSPTTTVDPAYSMGISSPPAAGTYTGCVGGVRTFQPGTYTDPTVLTSCAKNVFPPATNGTGYYYFNFPNSNSSWNPAGETVIGGTLSGSQTDCDSTKPGVEFIFGGQSNLVIGTSATFHVCASPTTSSQQIAIYGVGNIATLNPSSPAVASGYSNPQSALAIDGVSATAALSGGGQATMTVQNFTNSIPAGSTISSVVLRIRHFESGNKPNNITNQVVVTPGGGSALTPIAVPVVTTGLQDFSTTLPASANTLAAISGLKAVYSSSISGNNATENLDGIVLDVTYAPSGFTAETGCAGTCPIINPSGNSNNADVTVSGTVYAPIASVMVNATNTSGHQEFDRGIIARSISIDFTGSVVVSYLIASTPHIVSITPANRTVLFVATVLGRPRVTATVAFDDSACPSNCGQTVTVKAWSASP